MNRRDAMQPACDALLGVVDDVLPVDAAIMERTKAVVLARAQLSARDAIRTASP